MLALVEWSVRCEIPVGKAEVGRPRRRLRLRRGGFHSARGKRTPVAEFNYQYKKAKIYNMTGGWRF